MQVFEDVLKALNLFHQTLILCTQLVLLQTGQLTQAHFNNGSGLYVGQFKAGNQILTCLVRSLRSTNDADDFVDIVAGNDESLQNMSTLLGLIQLVAGTTCHHRSEERRVGKECRSRWSQYD